MTSREEQIREQQTSRGMREQREAFAQQWYLTQKAGERMAGVLLLFAGALVLALDKPADQISALAAAAAIAGGLTFFFRSRRGRQSRTALAFVNGAKLNTYALYASLGATFAFWQGINQNRFVYLLIGGLLVLFAIWMRWRASNIREYDSLFPKLDVSGEAEDN